MIYVDKDFTRLTKAQWEALQGDESYRVIRHYLNDRFRVRVVWHGIVDQNAPQEHWKPFRLDVSNRMTCDSEGVPYREPKEATDVEACDDFHTAAEAIANYEHFLCTYANCEWLPGERGATGEQKMHFIERGNQLAPLSPDVPSVNENLNAEISDDLNSW